MSLTAGEDAMPRWFWLLPLVAAALWWPIDPFWASDDWFAYHYAQDLSRVLADFTGPQYGAADLFYFYRPLITLSLWVELQIGGSDPFVAHLDNVLAHAGSALLVACLWRRLLVDGHAFFAGLLWACTPMHIGGIGWAVGRTDGFSTLFGLLSILFFLRWFEGRHRTRAWSLLAMLAALLCKETALCLPGLVCLLAFASSATSGLARWVSALRAAWPHVLWLLLYIGWRYQVLGCLGGYSDAAHDPLAMAQGLGIYALDLLNPLRWTAPNEQLPAEVATHPMLPWVGYVPALIAVFWCARKGRIRPALLGVAWFLLASVPLAGFFAQADNHHNLRYFCLAFAGLAGLCVAGGPVAILVSLLVFVPPLVQVRTERWRADQQSASMHKKLRQQLDDGTPGPWFVAGLPKQNATGTALQFHFGIDRMLLPPFAQGGVRVFAHRPVFDLPGAVRLFDDDGMPLVPPVGTTLLFRGAELLTTVPGRPLPELPLACEDTIDCTSEQLRRLNSGEVVVTIATPGVRPQAYRWTFFTATGYMGAVVANQAAAGAADGSVDLLRFFQQANWSDGRLLIRGLEPATIIDLSTEFPVWIEAGDVVAGGFRPTHAARRLIVFRFDRKLPALLRG